ncbi:MAG TPA: hypothetical protein VGZ00_11625 [Candidatus Baltobacteraceae bacterium]|nr:hypothetical protein [Candidatus Baltobacteraceae bacterium]
MSFYSYLSSAVDIDREELCDYLRTIPGALVLDHDHGMNLIGNAAAPWHNHDNGPSVIMSLHGPGPEYVSGKTDEALVRLLGVPEPQSSVAFQHGRRGDADATNFLVQRIVAAIAERWSPCAYHFDEDPEDENYTYYSGEDMRQATRLGVDIHYFLNEQELLPLRIAQALQPERRVHLTRVSQAPPVWDRNLQPWEDFSRKSDVPFRQREFHYIYLAERISAEELRTFLRSFPGMYAPENGIVCRRYSDHFVPPTDASMSAEELKRFDIYDGYITEPLLPKDSLIDDSQSVYLRLLPMTWTEMLDGWFSDEEPVEERKRLHSEAPAKIIETLGSAPQSIISLVQIGVDDTALAQEVVCALARRWRCVYLLRCPEFNGEKRWWDETVSSGEDVCKAVRCGVDVLYVSEEYRAILPPEIYDEPQLTYIPPPDSVLASVNGPKTRVGANSV